MVLLFSSSHPSPPGLQTPVLKINNTEPYANEKFTIRCSAPHEKGSLIFGFYQKFRTGEVRKLRQLGPTGNSWETTMALRLPGDSVLYCDYELNMVSGSWRSNRSAEIQMIVKGDRNRTKDSHPPSKKTVD